MSGWQRRLATMPLSLHFLFQAVLFGGLTYALRRAIEPSRAEPWWVAVLGGVVFGLFMTWFVSRQRERYGSADQMLTLAQALKKGRLPEDADPGAWRAVLDRQERTMRRLRRWGPVEFAAFAALDITFALTRTSVWWWVFLVFFVGMFVLSLVTPRRRLAQIERLRDQLHERSP
jgi:hypothetical protein